MKSYTNGCKMQARKRRWLNKHVKAETPQDILCPRRRLSCRWRRLRRHWRRLVLAYTAQALCRTHWQKLKLIYFALISCDICGLWFQSLAPQSKTKKAWPRRQSPHRAGSRRHPLKTAPRVGYLMQWRRQLRRLYITAHRNTRIKTRLDRGQRTFFRLLLFCMF